MFKKLLFLISFLFNLHLISCGQINPGDTWYENSIIPSLNEGNFFQEVSTENYVLVDFYTKWCIYCKIMKPDLERIYTHYLSPMTRKRFKIYRIDAAENQ